MSKLAEFRQLEKHLAEQLQALEALKGVWLSLTTPTAST